MPKRKVSNFVTMASSYRSSKKKKIVDYLPTYIFCFIFLRLNTYISNMKDAGRSRERR